MALYYGKLGIYLILFFGSVTTILFFLFPESLDTPSAKALKFPLRFKDEYDLLEHLNNILPQYGYELYPDVKDLCEETIAVYVNPKHRFFTYNILDYYIVFKFEELNGTYRNTVELIDNLRCNFLQQYYSKHRSDYYVHVTEIILVDKETPTFKKIANDNLEPCGKDTYLNTSISLDKKTVYVVQRKYGMKFDKSLGKKFLKVMELTMEDQIKK